MAKNPNPTLETEMEGYHENGAPGELKRGGAAHHKRAHGGAMEHEHEKKEEKPKRHRRKAGGHIPEGLKKHDEEEEAEAHHKARKHGGKVAGKAAMHRPDKRARGGATSDQDPITSAGKMSSPSYERKQEGPYGGGEGADNKGGECRD